MNAQMLRIFKHRISLDLRTIRTVVQILFVDPFSLLIWTSSSKQPSQILELGIGSLLRNVWGHFGYKSELLPSPSSSSSTSKVSQSQPSSQKVQVVRKASNYNYSSYRFSCPNCPEIKEYSMEQYAQHLVLHLSKFFVLQILSTFPILTVIIISFFKIWKLMIIFFRIPISMFSLFRIPSRKFRTSRATLERETCW